MAEARISGRYFTVDGLDAVGKGNLLKGLEEQYQVIAIKTPDMLIDPWRSFFDQQPLPLRYAYYCLGNCLTSKRAEKALGDDNVVIQDRSWLTTQAAHQVRGLSESWLQAGNQFARLCLPPNLAVIIEVEEDERKRRLERRGYLRPSDRENINFAGQMNRLYYAWAEKLGWKAIAFENTAFTPETAVQKLTQVLGLGGR